MRTVSKQLTCWPNMLLIVILLGTMLLSTSISLASSTGNDSDTESFNSHLAGESQLLNSYGTSPMAGRVVNEVTLPSVRNDMETAKISNTLSIQPDFGKLPLAFVPNAGQTNPAVRFQVHSMSGLIFFTPGEIVLSLPTPVQTRTLFSNRPDSATSWQPDSPEKLALSTPLTRTVVRLRFEGTNPNPDIEYTEQLPGSVNYFTGNDPSKWRTNLPTYAGIIYRQLYPGVDVHYEGIDGLLKSTYTVTPGADPTLIRWRYNGATKVQVDETTGDLLVTLPVTAEVKAEGQKHSLIEHAPTAWQIINNEQIFVSIRYTITNNDRISFILGDYDPTHPLIIDPQLTYSTSLGGSEYDQSSDITVDSAGNVYLTGSTYSTDFPTINPPQPTLAGSKDAFVIKLNSTGSALVYATYLGGSGHDTGKGIAVDSTTGDTYITGDTHSTNFPPVNPMQPACAGSLCEDGFIAKLNASGNTLLYSTYLGGSSNDWVNGIAIDGDGNAYITGWTHSTTNFPLLNPLQPTYGGGFRDAFVAKLNSTGSALIYATYLGGSSSDEGQDIAVDSADNAYITGDTSSTNFPGIDAQATCQSNCIFVAKLNATGSAFAYNTRLIGGSRPENSDGIAVDSAGNAYVTGYTYSSDFPTTAGAFDQFCGTDGNCNFDGFRYYDDFFVIRLKADGTGPDYGTFLGGSQDETTLTYYSGKNIAVDSAGNAYVVGYTFSPDFPTTDGALDSSCGTDGACNLDSSGRYYYDAFLVKVDPSQTGEDSLAYATFLGGSDDDFGRAVAVDETGNVYVTGETNSSDFIPPRVNGSTDIYVIKLDPGASCTPPAQLSPIGQAVATVVPPASIDCGSVFEDLVIIPPPTPAPGEPEDGTYAFQQIADAIAEADYEVDFTSMEWETNFDIEGSAGDIFLDGIANLRTKVASDPLAPSMTIRILMGWPKDYKNHPKFSKQIIIDALIARGIPLRETLAIGKEWRVEVADYIPRFLYHSHVKTLIVDGKTVIVSGYNMDDYYILDLPDRDLDDIWRDMGVKLSGEIAQETLKMFDDLWSRSDGDPISHVEQVLSPEMTGSERITAFPLYRDVADPTAEEAIYEAIAASTQEVNLIQDRIFYFPFLKPLIANLDPPLYVEGIFGALDNGSEVRYIVDASTDREYHNLSSYCFIKGLYKLLHPLTSFTLEARNAGAYIHTKALSIDDQMLIVGSLNFDISSWHGPPLYSNFIDLAEYDVAIDDPDGTVVVSKYEDYFTTLWNSSSDMICLPGEQSIQNAVAQAGPNDIIILEEGVYQESIVIDKPLRIAGVSGKRTVIEPPNGQPAFRVTADGVSIKHLTVRGSTGYGIDLDGSTSSGLEDILIRNVLFEDNALGGLLAHGGPMSYTLENNTFIDGAHGVRVDVSTQPGVTSVLRNNLFFGQSAAPVKIDSATDGGVEYGYNLFNNCERAVGGVCPPDWYDGTLSASSNVHDNLLNLDPKFDTSVGYYTLSPGSPALDAGDPATQNQMGLDGRIPERADIGAFELELMIDPPDPFQEADGQVVMEAEHFTWNFGPDQYGWTVETGLAGAAGPGYISMLPDIDLQFTPTYTNASSQLDYTINFTTTGTYYVWLRGYAPNAAGDSIYVGLDDQPAATLTGPSTALGPGFVPRQWSWVNGDTQGSPVTFEVTQPGLHVLHMWVREDGLRLDRIILTTDNNYSPVGEGPPESGRFN